MFRFTIRDVLWLTVVVGLVLVLLPEIQRRREAERRLEAIQMSKRIRVAPQNYYDVFPLPRPTAANSN